MGTLRILEAIRILNLQKTKFYQASSSEIYGNAIDNNQNEIQNLCQQVLMQFQNFSYWITVNYRNAYKIFACNGILFNHESKKKEKHLLQEKLLEVLLKLF